MSMRDIMDGNISSSSELRTAIQYFSESDKKDSLSSVILESWSRLGKPYICINESSAFYEYAPNEMKPLRMNTLHESIEVNNNPRGIELIGTFKELIIQCVSKYALPKLMAELNESELTMDRINVILNKYENKYNNGDMDIEEFKICKSILNICIKLVENQLWFEYDSVLGSRCRAYVSEHIRHDSMNLIYNGFTPVNNSLDYYSTLTNGGLHVKLVEDLNTGYKPRVSDLNEMYDPSVNTYYKYPIGDSSHMIFCLNLIQWLSPNTQSNIIRDEAIIAEWNERVREYYGRLNSTDDEVEHAKCMQMLDDIMWDYKCNPPDVVVRKSNLNANFKRILVTPISLYVVCGGSPLYDDLLQMSQMSLIYKHSYGSRLVDISNHDGNTGIIPMRVTDGSSVSEGAVNAIDSNLSKTPINESVACTPVQQMLTGTVTPETYRCIGSLLDSSEPSVDASDLMYLDSLLEVKYQYAPLQAETAEMLSLKEKVSYALAKLYTDDLLEMFKTSVYFNMYWANKQEVKSIKLRR
jgi:hypothetical protein